MSSLCAILFHPTHYRNKPGTRKTRFKKKKLTIKQQKEHTTTEFLCVYSTAPCPRSLVPIVLVAIPHEESNVVTCTTVTCTICYVANC
jgi:hypothetical protein